MSSKIGNTIQTILHLVLPRFLQSCYTDKLARQLAFIFIASKVPQECNAQARQWANLCNKSGETEEVVNLIAFSIWR